MYSISSFFDFFRLSNALRRRLLLLSCSDSFGISLSAGILIDADFRGSKKCCLLVKGFGVVGRLGIGDDWRDFLGVAGRDFLGVVGGWLERDPVRRRRGKRCGETVRLSNSFWGMVSKDEKFSSCWESCEADNVEFPLLIVGNGVSLVMARTALVNSCQSSSSSRLQLEYFCSVWYVISSLSPTESERCSWLNKTLEKQPWV